jgi:hypothetical protein
MNFDPMFHLIRIHHPITCHHSVSAGCINQSLPLSLNLNLLLKIMYKCIPKISLVLDETSTKWKFYNTLPHFNICLHYMACIFMSYILQTCQVLLYLARATFTCIVSKPIYVESMLIRTDFHGPI